MIIFDLIENYFPYIFSLFVGLILIIITIGFLRRSKDWKRMEKKYSLNPNDFKKLGTLHQLRFDFTPYRNMFGLGINSQGIVLYPVLVNKLTHNSVLIPFDEIERYEMEDYRLNFMSYKKIKLYLNESIILVMSQYMATQLTTRLNKTIRQQTV